MGTSPSDPPLTPVILQPWQEPVVGGYPAARDWDELGGRGLWHAWTRGRLPRPPLAHLLDTQLTLTDSGEVAADMPASPWFQSWMGTFPAGLLAVLADIALGWALGFEQGPGEFYTTVEMKMDFVRPASIASERLRTVGHLLHAGQRLALTAADVVDARGRLLAHGTSLLIMRPASERAAVTQAQGAGVSRAAPEDWTPFHQRPPLGEVLSTDDVGSRSGRELLEEILAERLAPPPVAVLTGFRLTRVGDNDAEVTLPAHEWLRPPTPFVQGGITALLADVAMASAIWSTLPAGMAPATVSLKTNFIRPIPADGRSVLARGRVIHGGRTIANAAAEVLDASGKLVASALGTYMPVTFA
jgi:uncharacterized protein (TIGR00369 family)